MKITIYERIYGFFKSKFYEPIEIDCKGEGTEKNPAIIEETQNLPDIFILRNSKIFIQFKKCKIKIIEISNSENISIENISLKSIRIFHCLHITLKNCFIENCSWFRDCQKLNFESSRFEYTLEIDDVHNCYMKNCYFDRIKNYFSSNNIFENCDLYEKDMINLISKKKGLRDFDTLMFLLLLLFLFFMIVLMYFSASTPLFMLYSLIFLFIFVILVLFNQLKKIKKHKTKPPNIIK